MLTEYALTPELFDDEYNAGDPEWLEQLRQLGHRLLPLDQHQICNTVISNLYGGTWFYYGLQPIIDNMGKRQENDSSLLPGLDLLVKTFHRRIESHLVTRPCCADELPNTEQDWVNEAENSIHGSTVPLHIIISTSQIDRSTNSCHLPDSWKSEVWQGNPATQCLSSDLSQQVFTFRRSCTFYDFLAVCSPHLDVQGSKDLDFAVALINQAIDRPVDFEPLLRVDLHTKIDPHSSNHNNLAKRINDYVRDKLTRSYPKNMI